MTTTIKTEKKMLSQKILPCSFDLRPTPSSRHSCLQHRGSVFSRTWDLIDGVQSLREASFTSQNTFEIHIIFFKEDEKKQNLKGLGFESSGQ